MSRKVVNLAAWQEENQPTNTGLARCLACGHEARCVAPTGVVWLECPACRSRKMLFVGPCERAGKEWTCRCGNSLFKVAPEGVYCPNCGDWQRNF